MDAGRKMAIGFLMMKYGNGGPCCSADNHEYMKALFEGDDAKAGGLAHRVTKDCTEAIARLDAGDFSELKESQREKIERMTHWRKVIGDETA